MATAMLVISCISVVIQIGTLIAGGAALAFSPKLVGLGVDAGIFDIPFVNGISYFIAGIGYAKIIAFLLAQLFCIIGLVWNAFKLWAGAAQIKKTVIDIGARLIIFSFLFTWYVSITMNLLSLGTSIGEHICGGKNQAETMYKKVTSTILYVVEGYQDAEISQFNSLKNKTIGKSDYIKLINASSKATQNNFDDILKRYNINVVEDGYVDEYGNYNQTTVVTDKETSTAVTRLDTLLSNKMALLMSSGQTELTKEEIDKHKKEDGWKENVDFVVDEIVDEKGNVTGFRYFPVGDLTESYNNTLRRFDTIADFFGLKAYELKKHWFSKKVTKEEVKLTNDKINNKNYETNMEEYRQKIADWFSGLYLKFGTDGLSYAFGNVKKDKMTKDNAAKIASVDGSSPQYISPGSIVKMGTLLAALLRAGDDTKAFKKGQDRLWKDIIDFILWVIQMLMIQVSCVIMAIEYVMMILEYHIVTTISYIFLPLMLFEGTRQYATRLLGTFFNYFVRILVFVVIFYFCIDTYLQMIYSQFSGLIDPGATESFSQCLLTCFLCLILTQKVPQLAQSILSGSPSMGAGDVARAAHGVMHGAMMGRNMAGRIVGASRAAGTAVGKSFGNSAVAAAGKKHAAQEAIAKAKAEGKTNKKELKAIGKQAGGSWLHSHGMSTGQRMSRFVGNLYSQAAFGIKDNYTDKEKLGGLGMGYGNSTNQKATLRDAMNSATGNGAQKDGGTKPSESQPSSEASKAAEQKPIGKAEGKAAVRAGDTGAKSPDYPETAQGGSSGMTGSGNGGAGSAAAAQKKPQPDSKRSSYTPPAQATQGGGSTQKPASNGVAKQQSGNTAQKPSGSRPKSSATPKHPQSGGKPYSRKSGNGRRK